MKKVSFPKDGQAHDCSIEWWYFNGHLAAANGRKYAYMNCLFKARIKDFFPIPRKIPLKYAFFSHSIISDIKTGKSYPQVNYVSLVSKDSFKKPLLFINYTNPLCLAGYVNSEITEIQKFRHMLKTEQIELEMLSRKKPLLEGGSGFMDLKPEKSYCYSLSSLQTKGFINLNGKAIPVKGKSWFDHQWANVTSTNKWNWLSIQLSNNLEIVCFEYDGTKKKTRMATISYPNNKQETFHNIIIEPDGRAWQSPKTRVAYPLEWKVEIPERQIFLKAKPLMKNQELSFGAIKYWEGPMKISGTVKSRKVSGFGFLELVGRPKQRFNLGFLRKLNFRTR